YGASLAVYHLDRQDLSGPQSVGDKALRFLDPGHDIDLFAVELVDDILDPHAMHADAGADRIDAFLAGRHGNLGPRARLTRDRFELDRTVEDLRYFDFKQPADQSAMAARNNE